VQIEKRILEGAAEVDIEAGFDGTVEMERKAERQSRLEMPSAIDSVAESDREFGPGSDAQSEFETDAEGGANATSPPELEPEPNAESDLEPEIDQELVLPPQGERIP
jgi:hypothetical protein